MRKFAFSDLYLNVCFGRPASFPAIEVLVLSDARESLANIVRSPAQTILADVILRGRQ